MTGLFEGLNAAVADTFGETDTDGTVDVSWPDAPSRDRGGIFDSRHYAAGPGGEAEISDLETTLSVVDDPDDPILVGERVAVRGATWTIVDARPDGQGMTVYVLEAAS